MSDELESVTNSYIHFTQKILDTNFGYDNDIYCYRTRKAVRYFLVSSRLQTSQYTCIKTLGSIWAGKQHVCMLLIVLRACTTKHDKQYLFLFENLKIPPSLILLLSPTTNEALGTK